jgi:hypothetical protein
MASFHLVGILYNSPTRHTNIAALSSKKRKIYSLPHPICFGPVSLVLDPNVETLRFRLKYLSFFSVDRRSEPCQGDHSLTLKFPTADFNIILIRNVP